MAKKKPKKAPIPIAGIIAVSIIVLMVGLFAVYELTLVKKSLTIQAGDIVVAQDFVNHSNTKAEFAEGSDTFDVFSPGKYNVRIKCGLFTRSATLVIEDNEPPDFNGVKDFEVTIGDVITYRDKVNVTDNCDDNPTVKVDSFLVHPNELGTYPVTYTAKDKSGNMSTEILWITISEYVEEVQYDADEQEVNEKAEQILSSIITEGMSAREKARAIFDYVVSHVSYISYSEKGDIIRAAKEGLVNGRGDCYVFYATSKVLLDRAGIANESIERVPTEDGVGHYWNLVDIGDGHGWYHFDTTPTVDKIEVFLWDDSQVKEYSKQREGYYEYDENAYPQIQ